METLVDFLVTIGVFGGVILIMLPIVFLCARIYILVDKKYYEIIKRELENGVNTGGEK